MEVFGNLFAQFGYPALVTGALLWLMVKELGELKNIIKTMDKTIEANTIAMTKIETTLSIFLGGKHNDGD